jgi:hypothetical protein
MKNLNKLGVQEMDTKDIKETDGGKFTFLNWIGDRGMDYWWGDYNPNAELWA